MKRFLTTMLGIVICLGSTALLSASQPIKLANEPALSPDGKTLAFAHRGDLWIVPTKGGGAERITFNSAQDSDPHFSPDGKTIAFISNRTGSSQVFVVPAAGGAPKQVTHHTAGFNIEDWYPDGTALLVSGQRDHHWRSAQRCFRIPVEGRAAEQLVFDAYGRNFKVSPDGKKILFDREGERWWRKGYRGSRANQVWMYDTEIGEYSKLVSDRIPALWALWNPTGGDFYYVHEKSGSHNLWSMHPGTMLAQQLTHFEDDTVAFPCISRDGSTIVFRHLFDFYSYDTKSRKTPTKIEIFDGGDSLTSPTIRRTLTSATSVAFSSDTLEIAFVAGGDLWVMDTELREPKQITNTADFESNPVFSKDDNSILFISRKDGQSDIWKATRKDPKSYWWQNDEFQLTRVTNDAEVESSLSLTPDGKQMVYTKGRGNLYIADADGGNAHVLVPSFMPLSYDFSPDSKWIVYAGADNDFNNDIWVVPVDGSKKPFNVSRHPDNERNPVWSPDGKTIAFTGRRNATESDIYYVYLQKSDDEATSRSRKLKKALDKMKKSRKKKQGITPNITELSDEEIQKKIRDRSRSRRSSGGDKKSVKVKIDFEDIHERIHQVSIPDVRESNLFWSPDSKKLAFSASIKGSSGTYTVSLPENTSPTLLTSSTGSDPKWLSSGSIAWLVNGVPTLTSARGGSSSSSSTTSTSSGGRGRGGFRRGGRSSGSGASSSPGRFTFSANQEINRVERYAAGFDEAWRQMRDSFYDESHNNRNWDEIRRKYKKMASESPDDETFSVVANLMLGELNGSHLGFRSGSGFRRGRRGPRGPRRPTGAGSTSTTWQPETVHLGVRFVADYKGPGLKVRDIIPNGPATKKESKIEAGDIILAIDGQTVDPGYDLTQVLNGRLDRDMLLKVRGIDKKDRTLSLRPTRYSTARRALYQKWVRDNRKMVEKLAKGKLGYLHVAAMSQPSFLTFERELFSVGYGKDGIIIDVRENGGGSTTDHLLTSLTQPVHAITVPRGGGRGYPQDRKIYSSWSKPIIVLCNQNSYSNAEIFAHAIRNLKRGNVVGVQTAGGVISTGSARIMDLGTLRMPFRGWYVRATGEDMELNGALPHVVVWNKPGEIPAGKDVQLEKGVEVLTADVKEWKAKPPVKLRKASERRKKKNEGGRILSGGR